MSPGLGQRLNIGEFELKLVRNGGREGGRGASE